MNQHNNTGTATEAATRTLQDVADELGVPIDWVLEEGLLWPTGAGMAGSWRTGTG